MVCPQNGTAVLKGLNKKKRDGIITEEYSCIQDEDCLSRDNCKSSSIGLCIFHQHPTQRPPLREPDTIGMLYKVRYLIGPMVYIQTYIFNHLYQQYLVLLTMVPRNRDMAIEQQQ